MAKENKEESEGLTEAKLLATRKSLEEGWKLYYDAMKHLTTLSTGSTLILVAFLEKIFKSPEWRFLVAGTFIGFIFSIIGSFSTMLNLAHIVAKHGADKQRFKHGNQAFYFSSLSFIFGLICLATFTLKNLF